MAALTVEQWIAQPARFATAVRSIHDVGGCRVKTGEVGEICDYLPYDGENGYVVVNFSDCGAVLCSPDEVRPV